MWPSHTWPSDMFKTKAVAVQHLFNCRSAFDAMLAYKCPGITHCKTTYVCTAERLKLRLHFIRQPVMIKTNRLSFIPAKNEPGICNTRLTYPVLYSKVNRTSVTYLQWPYMQVHIVNITQSLFWHIHFLIFSRFIRRFNKSVSQWKQQSVPDFHQVGLVWYIKVNKMQIKIQQN